MGHQAADLAHRLARDAEAVCRHYLSSGRREGRYWLVGKGAAGKFTEYVAARVMLRRCDWALSHARSSASTQHNLRARGFA
jgi:hypothetical protein